MAVLSPGKAGRFVTLDGLRGVGAICVVAGHSGDAFGGYAPKHFYLAVDMFFVLSGFVIARAYDHRFLSGLTLREFIKARIYRLYPIYLVGMACGLGALCVSNIHRLSHLQIAESFVLGLFGLPSPSTAPWWALFPLNAPFWSLFLEFWCANLLYGIFWRQLRGRNLTFLVALSAALLVSFAVLKGTFNVGWTWPTLPGGVARVCFSFFAGVWLFRLHDARGSVRHVPAWACLAACVAAFMVPVRPPNSLFYDMAVALVFFPALIYLGAGATEIRPWIGRALGDISYALYAIHRPLLIPVAWLKLRLLGPANHRLESVALQAVFIMCVSVLAWWVNRLTQSRRKTPAAQTSLVTGEIPISELRQYSRRTIT